MMFGSLFKGRAILFAAVLHFGWMVNANAQMDSLIESSICSNNGSQFQNVMNLLNQGAITKDVFVREAKAAFLKCPKFATFGQPAAFVAREIFIRDVDIRHTLPMAHTVSWANLQNGRFDYVVWNVTRFEFYLVDQMDRG